VKIVVPTCGSFDCMECMENTVATLCGILPYLVLV
jgi:hypothetical protein